MLFSISSYPRSVLHISLQRLHIVVHIDCIFDHNMLHLVRIHDSDNSNKTDRILAVLSKTFHINQYLELQMATRTGEELNYVSHYIDNRWPCDIEHCNQHTRAYYHIRHEFVKTGDIILRKNALVIPQAVRKHVLNCIHDGHFGPKQRFGTSTRSRILARNDKSKYYFPSTKMGKENHDL